MKTNRDRSFLDKLGIGGLAFLILLAGAIPHLAVMPHYRLVLRDEPLLFGAPAPFVYTGAVLTVIVLFILRAIAWCQNRVIGWGLREGRTRGGPLQWEDVILCVVPGVLLATVAAAYFINSRFDQSPEQMHSTAVVEMYSQQGHKRVTRYCMVVTDWKQPQEPLAISVTWPVYNAYQAGKQVQISTRRGFLGYEWITAIE